MTTHARLYVVFTILMGLCLGAQAATNQYTVVNDGDSAYLLNGDSNTNLTLVRGYTYTFDLFATGHPFWIKTIQGIGTGNAYTNGVTGNGTQVGTVTFDVPIDAPSLLYYNCQDHTSMTGELNIIDPPTVTITHFVADTSAILVSSGTDALNFKVEYSTNLVSGSWTDANILFNDYTAGTYTTVVTLPAPDKAFFRILQGFF